MKERKSYFLIRRFQYISLLFLILAFIGFEKYIGIKNYTIYRDLSMGYDILNDNIIMIFSILFILSTGVGFMYSSIGRIEKGLGFETLLIFLIFIVWWLMYKNRSYYLYGLILGIVANFIQGLKIISS